MKQFYFIIISIITFAMFNVPNARADRGDLLEHEVLEHFESEEVVSFFIDQFDGFINPDEMPEFFTLATLFFQQLIDQRNITVHKLQYETIDFYGEPVIASGIIMIPGHENYTCTPSFSIYAHGTVFDREAVNSRPANWGGEFMLTLMMASINTICVAPDYYGLGDGDGFHHHNTYRTNVNSSLDCIRAGRQLCDELGQDYNNRLMPMGYSEGGHASMGVARMIRDEGLEDEFIIPFVGAGSGAYDMSGEAFDFILGDPFYATPQYILYQAATCEDIYGNIILEEEGETFSDFLQSPYDALFEEHVLSQDGNMGWVTHPWTDMFHPEKIEDIVTDQNHPFRQCLANSNVFEWFNNYPTLMYYCTTDEQVPYTGALKTRDVQRSLIPWYLFWNRFKIQALDLTLWGVIPNHSTCALPSIFIQTALMDRTLGLSCEYTGREAMLRTADGEALDGKIIYFPKTIDLNEMAQRLSPTGGKVSISGMNMQTGTSFDNQVNSRIAISENGFYLIKVESADGSSDIRWLYKAEPDFVNTDDYDPIRTNPMDTRSQLDLSQLEDVVNQVAILDLDGNEHVVINGPFESSVIDMHRSSSMVDGTYIVEVRTARYNFTLQLEVESEKSMLADGFNIYPNPTFERIQIELNDCDQAEIVVNIFDVDGKAVKKEIVSTADCRFEISVETLSPGIYGISINLDDREINRKFVKLEY